MNGSPLTIVIFIHYKPRIAGAILDLQWMKMIWCGWKSKETCYILVNQFHVNLHSKTLSCREIKSVLKDVKWCFNASWGLKWLSVLKRIKTIIAFKRCDRSLRQKPYYSPLTKKRQTWYASADMIRHDDLISRVKLTCEKYGISFLKYIFDDLFASYQE